MKILKFYSPNCGPCKVVDNLLKQKNIDYFNINVYDPEYFTDDFVPVLENVEKDMDIITYYKIQSVPTLLKIDDEGIILNRLQGVPTDKTLEDFLNNNL